MQLLLPATPEITVTKLFLVETTEESIITNWLAKMADKELNNEKIFVTISAFVKKETKAQKRQNQWYYCEKPGVITKLI